MQLLLDEVSQIATIWDGSAEQAVYAEQVYAGGSLSDTFTRSGTLAGSTADTGQTWVAGAIAFTCDGSRTSTSGAGAGPTVDLGVPTSSVAADFVSAGGGAMAWMAGRFVDANNCYLAFVAFSGTEVQIIRVIGGAWTYDTAHPFTNGARVQLDFSDAGGSTTVTISVNGVVQGTYVDSDPSRPIGTKVGFGSTNGGGTFDNLTAT